MTGTLCTVPVETSGHSYDVLIGSGLLDRAGELIGRAGNWQKAFILTDTSVADLYLGRLTESLNTAGCTHHTHVVPAGEASKSFAMLERVVEDFIAAGAERDDLVIALGGGVVGDLAGLVSGLLKRGAPVVQIPTTLLAQVDSSIGGKTAINSIHGKNLVGLFHQPCLVLADTDVLSSLPRREIRAGLAEIIKCALICDRDFFDRLAAHSDGLCAADGAALVWAIEGACRIKAGLVSADERERGSRALLNLGHTFGHALEAVNGYRSSLLHGEAVGCGLALAFGYSAWLGVCSSQEARHVVETMDSFSLPARMAELDGGPYPTDGLIAAMRQDKKVTRGQLTLILAKSIGNALICNAVDIESVRDFLNRTQPPQGAIHAGNSG